MKLGILKADTVNPELAQEFGEYPDMIQRLLLQVDPALEFRVFDVQHGEYPAEPGALAGYLITGSRASVYDDQVWIRQLEDFVRRLHAARIKLVGICFGHQLVAQALGGRTERAAVGWGVGVHAARWYRRPAWAGERDSGFRLLASHRDQVVQPAPGSEVLAGSDFCPNAVCRIGNHILTFQGHPEFVTGYSKGLMDLRRAHLGEAVYGAGVASLATPTDHLAIAHWIIDFLRS